MSALTAEIEPLEEDGEKLVLTGIVASEEERQAAHEVTGRVAGDRPIEDNIEINAALPDQLEAREAEREGAMYRSSGEVQPREDDSLEPGDFTAQRLQKSPQRAPGPDSSLYDDEVSEGDNAYVPPSDPVIQGREVVGGLQPDSMESVEVEPSALDDEPGDEALRDAILRELREDTATTAFEIDVTVDRKVARLGGRVADLDDAANVEEVAARVPGLVEVIEELEVAQMEEGR